MSSVVALVQLPNLSFCQQSFFGSLEIFISSYLDCCLFRFYSNLFNMSDSEEIEEMSDICVISKDSEIFKNANSVGEKSQSIGSKSDLVYDYFQLVDSNDGSWCFVQGCK